jgi:hypothetical protein
MLKETYDPVRLYHGSSVPLGHGFAFTIPNTGTNSYLFGTPVEVQRHGAFLTDNPEFAKQYGRYVYEFDVIMNNPAHFTRSLRAEFIDTLDPFGPERDLWVWAKHAQHAWQFLDDELGARFVPWLKQQGYDCLIFEEEVMTGDEGFEGQTYVVFDPSHIRLVGQVLRESASQADGDARAARTSSSWLSGSLDLKVDPSILTGRDPPLLD